MNFLNNTFFTLETAINSSDRVIFAKNFSWNLGEIFPLSAVIAESDETGKVIKREIIRIIGRNDKMISVERAVELCPQSDDAENQTQNPLNFSENAVVYHTLTAGDLRIIKEQSSKDIPKKYTKQLLCNSGTLIWTKIGNFSGGQSARLYMKLMGGWGFWANDAHCSEVIECMLTLGNGNHTRNLSGFWRRAFKTNTIIYNIRVVRIDNYSWDIYVYHIGYSNSTMVEISHSGEFREDFSQINAPHTSGDTIYDISEKVEGGIDIGGLPEIFQPTNIYDFFVVKEFNGTNKKVTLENLRKWVLNPRATSGSDIIFSQYISSSYNSNWVPSNRYAIPNGAIVTYGTNSGSIDVTIHHSTDNNQTRYNWNEIGRSLKGWSKTQIVPQWFIYLSSYVGGNGGMIFLSITHI